MDDMTTFPGGDPLSTIDVDVRFEPESESILRAIPQWRCQQLGA